MVQYNYMQYIKYILKGRIISMNEKEKDTIILKSIIKEKYNMEMEYTGYKGQNCIQNERKIL